MENLNGFIGSWMSHRKALMELLDVVDSEHLNYKPWEDAMSFSELVIHITSSMDMFAQTVKSGEFTPPKELKSFATLDDLKLIVQSETEETTTILQSLNSEQLSQLIEFYGMNLPGMTLLENAKDHEIHHKGQIFTYARMTGAQNLPFFISRS
ncbi:DinB family protein [Litchfieldia alkalitelluris]|uniref:DinB family protein n=1 Tax=Litchfieldia alkalitelluris TaxID=304268 RepID=UPI000998C48E|nr:DinB family protein [Litchfieldia alkalitelluris]